MKIIDEKGRLFGKINVIDFMVILIFLFLVPAFYFGYKIIFEQSIDVLERGFVEIEINCRLIKLRPNLLKMISVGEKELDENGEVIGEIISLGQSEPYEYEFDIGEQRIIKEDAILKQVEARLKFRAEDINSKPYYKDKMIEIGSPLEFKINNFTLIAIPYEEAKEEEERIINLYVTLIDLDQKLLKDISVGDKETDENDNTIAEILSLNRVEGSSLKFDLGSGSVVKEEEGAKKQISARMRLKCQVEEGEEGTKIYFKEKEVEHNSMIKFKTDKYEITGLVTLNEKWLKLRVKALGVIPEVANFIRKGDVEKDVFGRTIGRIDSILSNESALVVEGMTEDGKFITLNHPFNRSIVVLLDALCIEKDGAYYYKDSLAKMGSEIAFGTTSYSILGRIVGLRIE